MLRILVLRTKCLDEARHFYESLGFQFTEEQYGTGPRHYAAAIGDSVFELYPSAVDVSDTTRLGFTVQSLTRVMDRLKTSNAVVVSPLKATTRGFRAVVRDPDGRAVELDEC